MQRLSIVIMATLLLSSFIFWPQFDLVWYTTFKHILFFSILFYFVHAYLKLRQWFFNFSLNEEATLIDFSHSVPFQVKRLWVSPWVCAFYLIPLNTVNEPNKKLVLLWQDMLDKKSYRFICRTLLTVDNT
ncbi:MAG: protein YgfX [Parashewanella sp.]